MPSAQKVLPCLHPPQATKDPWLHARKRQKPWAYPIQVPQTNSATHSLIRKALHQPNAGRSEISRPYHRRWCCHLPGRPITAPDGPAGRALQRGLASLSGPETARKAEKGPKHGPFCPAISSLSCRQSPVCGSGLADRFDRDAAPDRQICGPALDQAPPEPKSADPAPRPVCKTLDPVSVWSRRPPEPRAEREVTCVVRPS
jgi:hypothetical protein